MTFNLNKSTNLFAFMINKHFLNTVLSNKQDNSLVNNLLFVSIVVGASVGYLLVRMNTINKKRLKSESRIITKSNRTYVLGEDKDGNNPIKVNLQRVGSLNWRKNRDQSMFPPVPDPTIRIN